MIKFWSTSGKYGAFSNFYSSPIFLDNKWWKTTEHYYQAQKTTNEAKQNEISLARNAKIAKQIATECELREDWEDIKYNVMKKALFAKFTQHTSLKNLLISTGDEAIGEDSPYDYIWGLGKNGSGQNLLGKALEEIREQIKSI